MLLGKEGSRQGPGRGRGGREGPGGLVGEHCTRSLGSDELTTLSQREAKFHLILSLDPGSLGLDTGRTREEARLSLALAPSFLGSVKQGSS